MNSLQRSIFALVFLMTVCTDVSGYAQQRWSVRQSNTTQSLNGIHFPNRFIGFSAGSNGLILTTNDGGLSWKQLNTTMTETLFSIYALDAQTVWAVGTKGLILYSRNAGIAWVQQNSQTQATLRKVQFLDNQRGFICGDSATLLYTRNSGASWQRIQTPFSSAQSIRGMAFTTERIGWICGDGAQILATRDGGATWQEQHSFQDLVSLASLVSFASASINSISLVDSSNAWAVGSYRVNIPLLGSGAATNIFTKTPTQTWRNQLLLPRPITNATSSRTALRDIDFVNSLRGWVCGNEGLRATTDGGQTWVAETGTQQFDLNAVFALDTNHIWAVGMNGTILQYTPLTISGRVLQNNVGVSGVQVSTATSTVFTDNSGRFVLNVASGSHGITPRAQGLAFFPSTISIEVRNQNIQEQNFVVQSAASIRGRITSSTASVVGQTVILYPGQKTTKTDSTGEYRFNDLYPTRYQIVPIVSSSGLFEPRAATVDISSSSATQNFLLRQGTPPKYRVSGQITTLNNVPLANIPLTIEQVGDPNQRQIITDRNGSYSIDLQSDTYFITPASPLYTFLPRRMRVDVGDEPNVQNNFLAGAILRGLVGNISNPSTPIFGARVEITDSNGFKRRTLSNNKGEFRFDFLPTGSYSVKVARDRYGFQVQERPLSAPTLDSTAITFLGQQVSFSVKGRLINSRGTSQEGVGVELDVQDTTLPNRPKPLRTETDAEGVYRFQNLSGLPYRIRFFSDTLQFSTAAIIHTPQSSDSTEIITQAYPLGEIRGRVTKAQTQNGVREVKLTLDGTTTSATLSATDGTFRFTRVPDGQYNIRFERRGYSLSLDSAIKQDSSVRLSNGTSATFNVSGRQLAYDVSGQIARNNQGLSGVSVRLTNAQNGSTESLPQILSDSSGGFFIAGLDAGNYLLEFSRKGFVFAPSSVPISVSNQDVSVATITARRDTNAAQIYVLEKSGVEYLQFDAGEGRKWVEQGDILRLTPSSKSAVLSASPSVTLNDFLVLENLTSDFSINTRLKQLSASSARVVLKNIPFLRKVQDLTLYEGALDKFNLDTAGKIGLSFAKQGLEKAVSMLGSKLNIRELEFIGDISKASGIRVSADVELPNSFSCDNSSRQPPTIRLINVEVLRSGINFSGRIERIGPAAQICLDSLAAQYNSSDERLALSGGIRLPFLQNISAKAEMIGGTINSIGLRADLDKPIPFGPGAIKRLGGGVENLIAGNFSAYLNGTLVSFPQGVWEFNLNDARYQHPDKFNVNASLDAVNIVDWQMRGEAIIDVDVKSYVQFQAMVKAGTLDGNDYAAEGSAGLSYSWKPDTVFVGSIAAELKIPEIKLGGIADFLLTFLPLPIPVGNVGLKFVSKPRKKAFAGDFALNILGAIKPEIKFTIDMTNEPVQFIIGKGTQDLTEEALGRFRNRVRLTSEEAPREPWLVPMQPLLPPKSSAKGQSELTASSSETITISKDFAQVVISIKSQGLVPTTILESPTGERFTKSKDSILLYSLNPDHTQAFWTLNNPKPNSTWRLLVEKPQASDSIQIFAFPKNRPFKIQAETRGNELRVTWDTQGASPSATVDIFLDTDNQDGDGVFIGSTTERSGSFTYRLNDTLSACQYFVSALRDDNSVFTESYSPNPITNFKPSLPSPSIITSRSRLTNNRLNLVYLNPMNTLQAFSGYSLFVTNPAGRDSIYALTRAGNSMSLDSITLEFPMIGRYVIRLASFASDGRQGCFSDPISFTVNALTSASLSKNDAPSSISPITATPNPSDKEITFRLNLPQFGMVRLSLLTLLGQEVGIVAHNRLQGQIDIPFNTSALAQGIYIYRLEYNGAVYTEKISIIR
jgi:photosystem II stability/assembly factor-like uncharacterized protein